LKQGDEGEKGDKGEQGIGIKVKKLKVVFET